jgi:hypothetical protein
MVGKVGSERMQPRDRREVGVRSRRREISSSRTDSSASVRRIEFRAPEENGHFSLFSVSMSASTALNTNPETLTRFILEEQHRHPQAKGDLTLLLQSVQVACKIISSAIRKASLINLYGLAGATNVQGEDQKKLDVLSNDCFINTLKFSKVINNYRVFEKFLISPILVKCPSPIKKKKKKK